MTITSKEDMIRPYHDWLTEMVVRYGDNTEFTWMDIQSKTDLFYWGSARSDRFIIRAGTSYKGDSAERYKMSPSLIKYLENLNGK